jgi:hypothetical protein
MIVFYFCENTDTVINDGEAYALFIRENFYSKDLGT